MKKLQLLLLTLLIPFLGYTQTIMTTQEDVKEIKDKIDRIEQKLDDLR